MASDVAKLRELLTFTLDGEWGLDPAASHPYETTEMRIIRGTDFEAVQAGAINSVPIRSIRADIAKRKALQDGDVLIETAGGSANRSTGRVCLITQSTLSKADRPVTCASFARFLRFDKSKINPEFAYWTLQSLYSTGVMAEHQVQHTGIARFQFTKFAESQPIKIPPLGQQLATVDLLQTVQEMILGLTHQCEVMEAIARAIFKSWFVDFDPVRAKAEGREPDGMDAETAALFSSQFVNAELGLMPREWTTTTIAAICHRVVNGGTPSRSKPSYWQDGTIPWFKTGELSDAPLLYAGEKVTEEAIRETSTKVLPRHSVLMAIYAAPTVGRLGILSSPSAFNQACTGMIARSEVGPWFLYLTLQSGRDWFNSRANGAAQQNISKAIVESYQIVLPSPSLLCKFNEIVEPLFDKLELNAMQSKTVSELRDTLLPRLISGKLRVPEADKLVEAAL